MPLDDMGDLPCFMQTVYRGSYQMSSSVHWNTVRHSLLLGFNKPASAHVCVLYAHSICHFMDKIEHGTTVNILINKCIVSFCLSLPSNEEEDDRVENIESKEVIEDQMVHLITKDYIDLFGKLCNSPCVCVYLNLSIHSRV